MKDFSFEFEAIGTAWKIDLKTKAGELEDLKKLVVERVVEFEQTYSRFREDSLVAEFSKKAGVYLLPEDSQKLLDIYFKLHKLTKGLFTPLMGQVLEDAGYDKNYSLVSKDNFQTIPKLEECLEYDFPHLKLKKPVKMDFGAGGKGHIVDIVGELLLKRGVDDFCIDAGGDILYKNSLGEPLRIGLENPLSSKQAIGVVEVKDGSLCGSSGNRRKWANFTHIINPKTQKSHTNILATWVSAKSAMVADALATCLFLVEAKVLESEFEFEYLKLFEDFSVEKSANFTGELFGV